MRHNLFVLDVLHLKVIMSILAHEYSENLWHQRYGYLNLKNLRMLSDKKFVKGLKFQIFERVNFFLKNVQL